MATRFTFFTSDLASLEPRLCAAYSAIAPEILSVSPRELGVSRIGHFGFFRPDRRDTLWRGAAEWLEG